MLTEYLLLLKKRCLIILEGLKSGKEYEADIRSIDKEIASKNEVQDYGKFEVSNEKSFEKTCLFVNQELHKDAKKMTVMEYETAVEILTERNEEYEKIKSKRKR